MATAAEAMAFIRQNYVVRDSAEGPLELTFEFGDGRSHTVYVMGDGNLLIIKAPFATDDDISAHAALNLADAFGVSKLGSIFALSHVIPTDDLDPSEIDFGLKALCAHADELEKKVHPHDRL